MALVIYPLPPHPYSGNFTEEVVGYGLEIHGLFSQDLNKSLNEQTINAGP